MPFKVKKKPTEKFRKKPSIPVKKTIFAQTSITNEAKLF